MPLPLYKIVILGIKQISKPVSLLIKEVAKHNPRIRKYLCIKPAQMFNKLEVRSKILMLKMDQPVKVHRLPDPMATELGADILSEMVVIFIGIYLIYYEVSRQNEKDRTKHEAHRLRTAEIQHKLNELEVQVDQQDQELMLLKTKIIEFHKKI